MAIPLHPKRDITLLVVLTHCRITLDLNTVRSYYNWDSNGIRPPDFPTMESIHSLFGAAETFIVAARTTPDLLIVYGLVVYNVDVDVIIAQWKKAAMADVFFASLYTGTDTVIMTLCIFSGHLTSCFPRLPFSLSSIFLWSFLYRYRLVSNSLPILQDSFEAY